MSLILDALKRAERERKLENAPDLSAIYQEEPSGSRNYRSLLLIGAVLLCAFAVAIFFYWPKGPDTSELAQKRPETVETSSRQAKKAQPESIKKPSQGTAKAVKDRVPETSRNTAKKAVLATEKSLATHPERTPGSVVAVRETSSKAPAKIQATAPTNEEGIPARKPVLESVKKTRVSKRAVTGTKSTKTLPLFHRLPEEIRSVSGPLEINVHMYSPNPKERRVFINMKGYREGDVIGDTGFRLVEITQNGVVINYGKGNALLEVNGK